MFHDASTEILKTAVLLLSGAAAAFAVSLLTDIPLPVFPDRGMRGRQRHDSVNRSPAYRMLEPALRFTGQLMRHFLPLSVSQSIRRLLARAGEPLGLDTEEFAGLSIILAIVLMIPAALLAEGPFRPLVIAVAGAAGMLIPFFRLSEAAAIRRKNASRELPFAIDLLSLAMSAGADFLSALRLLVQQLDFQKGTLGSEFELVLKKIEFGSTKKDALKLMGERLHCDDIKSFVSTVIQADERGTPLARVLRIQAGMLRMHQTERAEQAAARAGLLILGPLTLIFISVFLILIGPFVVKAVRGEIFY